MKFRAELGFSRESYLVEFSSVKWSELARSEKEKHTLSSCTQCFELHEALQRSFPLKPVYHPEPVVVVDQIALQRQGARAFTTNVLSELNRVYGSETSSSFTDSLLKEKSLNLERKRTQTEKGGKRERYRKQLQTKLASALLRVQLLQC